MIKDSFLHMDQTQSLLDFWNIMDLDVLPWPQISTK